MKICNLKLNGLKEPIGYSFDYLTFSWDVAAQNLPQDIFFKVEVSTDEAFKNIVFAKTTQDSFNTLTTDTKILRPYTRFFWRVITENASASSFFETAKMSEPWQAEWISYQEPSVACVNIYKTITTRNKIKKARLYTVGLGVYEVSVNGKKVSDEFLTPGYHSYDLVQRYQTYDITDFLSQTTSEIKFLIGNGWYRGRFIFEGGFENIYGDKQKLIAEIHLEYADGTCEIIGTDNTWQTTTAIIQENSIYDGETIDYSAHISPLTTIKLQEGTDLLQARIDPPTKLFDTIKPDIFYDKEGNLILDFKQEITGWLCGNIPENKEEITFQFAELLQDGVFYRQNLRTAKQEFKILHTTEDVFIRPHFTYFGFRYVKVDGLTQKEAQNLTARVLQSEMDDIFSFDSSNHKLNKLISNIKWSQKDNFLSIPTDCPQRDERMGWTGDISIFSNTASYNMETRAFLGNYLKNLGLEQKNMGGKIPFFAPYPKIKPFEGMNPFLAESATAVWGDVATVLPLTLYKHYHDKGLLQANIETMVAWVDSIYQEDEAKGSKRLWHFGDQLADWLALDSKIPGCPLGATDSVLVASLYYHLSAKYTADALDILNDKRASFYRNLSLEIKQAMIEVYFKDNQLIDKPETLKSEAESIRQGMIQHFAGINIETRTHTQTGIAMLLRYGIYPNKTAKSNLIALLKQKMQENEGFLTTGFAGTPDLPHALLDNGLEQEAFEVLFKEESPSWLYEVNMGATTTWERWDSILPDGKISGTDMNSLNHYAYGAIEDFIIEKIIGINLPDIKDPKNIYHIQPHYTDHLSWIKGSLKTPNGEIKVSWHRNTSHTQVVVYVPPRTRVDFISCKGKTFHLEQGENKIEEMLV